MASEQPTFTIPADLIKPAIDAHINNAISEALNNSEVMTAAINAVLSAKVDDNGKVSTYGRENNRSFIEWTVQNAIREAATEAVQEAAKAHSDKIRERLISEMTRARSPFIKQLADAMMTGVQNASEEKWYLKLSVDMNHRGE